MFFQCKAAPFTKYCLYLLSPCFIFQFLHEKGSKDSKGKMGKVFGLSIGRPSHKLHTFMKNCVPGHTADLAIFLSYEPLCRPISQWGISSGNRLQRRRAIMIVETCGLAVEE